MNFNDIDSIRDCGFSGFVSIESLWNDKSCIPRIRGVYLVLNSRREPNFIVPGVGGFFKGNDPNVPESELRDNWVSDSLVVYVGKAGGPTSKATLQSRLSQYLRFGQGKNIGHWGGRLIWQLKNHGDLILCWKPTPIDDPRAIEKALIIEYKKSYGKMPYANLSI